MTKINVDNIYVFSCLSIVLLFDISKIMENKILVLENFYEVTNVERVTTIRRRAKKNDIVETLESPVKFLSYV